MYTLTFVLYNGIQWYLGSQSEEMVQEIEDKFRKCKADPSCSQVQKFVPGDGRGQVFILDLKNVMAIIYSM
jgi:hypothetical protein